MKILLTFLGKAKHPDYKVNDSYFDKIDVFKVV